MSFLDDTAVRALGDGRWETDIHPGWFAPAGPNGGYLAAVVARAMAAELDDPARRLRSLTLHYLSPTVAAPATLATTVERSGRSPSTVTARLDQGGRTAVLATAAFATDRAGIDFDDTRMPAAPPPGECEPVPAPPIEIPIRDRFDLRHALGGPPFQEADEAYTGGWIRLKDGEAADDLAVVCMTDAWTPAVFTRLGVRLLVPTVDLTVHLRRAVPDPAGWFLVVFRTTLSEGGFLEEDGEVWSEDGLLLAQSRQLAVASPVRE